MHLVARGAELRRVFAHEGLEEGFAMGRRRGVDDVFVDRSEDFVLRCHQLVQRRIGHLKPAVAHRALDASDRMAGHAAEARLRFRRIDLLDRRLLEAAVEEHRVIVAAGAPLRRLHAGRLLHVLDRLAIELVVERREVVHRAVPLLVDILMALPAGFRVEEELGRDRTADVGGRRRWEERAVRAAAFALHRQRRSGWIENTLRPSRRRNALAQQLARGQQRRQTQGNHTPTLEPRVAAPKRKQCESSACEAGRGVRDDQIEIAACSANHAQRKARERSCAER
ncbi:MAG: hypothetical protein R2748_18695 [Bryobacterales bacterium]